jgi:NADPH:quinone reductase-like Zn-dependent oxidoreductase
VRALTTTGNDDLLQITEVPEPRPAPSEALVRVQATSLNRGEVWRAKNSQAGYSASSRIILLVTPNARWIALK